MELITTLSESRSFASERQFDRLNVTDMVNFLYLSLLLLYIYRLEGVEWGRTYVRKTRTFGNYDYFRTTQTDLYMLAYVLLGNNESYRHQKTLLQTVRFSKSRFDRFLDLLTVVEPSETQVREYFYSLETQLRMNTYSIKNARRKVLQWKELSDPARVGLLTEIEQNIKKFYYAAEVLDKINVVRYKYG